MAEHGQLGAYWISEHLTKPLAQSHFCSLAGFAASTPDRNFCRRQIFHLDLSFSAFIFLTSRNFGFVNKLDFTKYTGAAGQWSHNSSGSDQNKIAMEQNLKTHDLGWKGANVKILTMLSSHINAASATLHLCIIGFCSVRSQPWKQSCALTCQLRK